MARPIRSAFPFFALVYLLTLPWWALSRFVTFDGLPDNLPVTDIGATFMPALAALILVFREAGMSGVKALFARVLDGRKIKNKGWLVVILLLPLAQYFLTYLIMRAAGLPVPAHLVLTPALAFAFPAFMLAAAGEELGYTGYVTDLLQQRHSALTSALIIGAPWALWHLPSMIQVGQAPGLIAWGLLATVAFRVIYVWLYNNAGCSLFAIILFHAVANTGRTAFPGGRAAFELDNGAIGYAIVIFLAVALTLVYGPKTLTRSVR
jgi:membrane protease YdiL (CAAX protease family)